MTDCHFTQGTASVKAVATLVAAQQHQRDAVIPVFTVPIANIIEVTAITVKAVQVTKDAYAIFFVSVFTNG